MPIMTRTTTSSVVVYDAQKRKGRRVAVRIVLRLRARSSILRAPAPAAADGAAECPLPVPAYMADIDSPAEPPRVRGVNVWARSAALARAWDLTFVDHAKRTTRLTFGEERVRHFDLKQPPSALMDEERAPVVKPPYDRVHTAAATVVDQVLHRFETGVAGGAEHVLRRVLVESALPPEQAEALCAEARAQAEDLLERCTLRAAQLPPHPQHNVRAALHQRAEARAWTPEHDADYIEQATTRVPDALTQRYLLTRTVSRTVGLDATPKTAELLGRVLEALGCAPAPRAPA